MALDKRFRPSLTAPSVQRVAVAAALTLGTLSVGCQTEDSAPAEPQASGRGADSHEHEHAHHEHSGQADSQLITTTRPNPPVAGMPTQLRAMIHRADGSMVNEFDVIHEKKLHLILVRKGLDEFAHLHPDIDEAGNAEVEHTFRLGGDYFVYADHQPKGEPQATAKATLSVEGENPAAPTLVPDVPGRVAGDGLSADVEVESTGEGETRSIAFALTDEMGQTVADLEPYLGALGHLVIVSEDGQEYVHAHPGNEGDATDGRVAFEAHFTKPGLYKGWGQFQRGGEVRTIPFVVRVE